MLGYDLTNLSCHFQSGVASFVLKEDFVGCPVCQDDLKGGGHVLFDPSLHHSLDGWGQAGGNSPASQDSKMVVIVILDIWLRENYSTNDWIKWPLRKLSLKCTNQWFDLFANIKQFCYLPARALSFIENLDKRISIPRKGINYNFCL